MRALLPLALLCALLLPATSAGQGDESSKTADQIIADMARDLGAVHSYHVEGTQSGKSGTSTLVGDVDASGRVRVRARQGDEEFAFIVTKSAAYARGNRGFWRREAHVKSKKTLKLLAGRWIKLPGQQDIPGLVEQ